MLISSPLFLFFFLPLAFLIYFVMPDRVRYFALVIICAVYYAIAGISNPFLLSLVCICVLILFLGSRLISVIKPRVPRTAVLVLLILGLVAATVTVCRYSSNAFVGSDVTNVVAETAIRLLLIASCFIDVYRRDAAAPGITDSIVFMMFFPIMIAGPVVKYKDFLRVLRERSLTVSRFAKGAQFYMRGFIKRFAIGAVLNEVYEDVIAEDVCDIPVFMGLAMLVIASFMMYAILSGYSDMGSGIALMFGLELPSNFDIPIICATLDGYFMRFMTTLFDFADDYVIRPILRGRPLKSVRGFFATVVAFFLIGVWYREDPKSLLIALPICVIAAGMYVIGVRDFVAKHKALAFPMWLCTFAVISVFWMALRLKDPFMMMEYVLNINFSGAHYGNTVLLNSISYRKYVITAGLVVVMLIPALIRRAAVRRGRSENAIKWAEFAESLILLPIFAFTVIFYMPQFPLIGSSAFNNLV